MIKASNAWDNAVNEIKIKYSSKKGLKIDLAQTLKELSNEIARSDAIRSEFHRLADDDKAIDSLIKHVKKTLIVIKNLSLRAQEKFFINTINIKYFLHDLKKMRDEYPKKKSGKKYPRSIPIRCISRLAGIFHKLSGEVPRCKHCQNYEEYEGKFYDFLLDLKPHLKEIGINLGKDSTIGTYAEKECENYKEFLSMIRSIKL